jgi:hypothetical protein
VNLTPDAALDSPGRCPFRTEGLVLLHNLDPASAILVGPGLAAGGMQPMEELRPGDQRWLRPAPGAVLWAQAVGAPARLHARPT